MANDVGSTLAVTDGITDVTTDDSGTTAYGTGATAATG